MACRENGGSLPMDGPTSDGSTPSSSEHSFAHNSEAAEAFCELCQYVVARWGSLPTPKAAAWWEEHQRRDRAKAAREMLRQQTEYEKEVALNKLTEYEKKLLRLK